MPVTFGQPPHKRFGASLVEYKNKLWVVGGGVGSDLVRSGYDLTDIHTLDLATMEWSQVETVNAPPAEQ